MGEISTVSGYIDTKDMGMTLMHEHVAICDWGMKLNFSQWFNRDEFLPYAKKMIGRAKERGIVTLLDATTIDLGRDIDLIKRVAQEAQINIIVSTGFYFYENRWIMDKSPEFLASLLIGEIEKGIMKTGIKPAVIKCASDRHITDGNTRLLKAAAMAHRETGIPVITHATNGVSVEQQEILCQQGVDPKKIIMGHSGDLNDLKVLEKLLKKGSMVGLDRFGLDQFLPLEERVAMLASLCNMGYTNQIVLSHDCCIFLDMPDFAENIDSAWEFTKKRDLDRYGYQFSYIPDVVFPLLLQNGLTKSDVKTMMIDNPRKFFDQ